MPNYTSSYTGTQIDTAIGRALSVTMTSDTTVNFNSSMTASEIQALIDDQPKNLNGGTLTFQFADGTYTIGSTTLWFYGFHGGVVLIRGNTSESSEALHSNQAVTLNFSPSSSNQGLLNIFHCSAVRIWNIKFNITNGSYSSRTIYSEGTGNLHVDGCCFIANSAAGIVLSLSGCFCRMQYNYITAYETAIYAYNSSVYSITNSTLTTNSTYGIYSVGSSVYKNSTQPTGSTASEVKEGGGQIF